MTTNNNNNSEEKFNPYKILGIDKSATEEQIQKAYSKMTKMYHPDKNIGIDTHDLYTKINEAYSILTNETARIEYDENADDDDDIPIENMSGYLHSGRTWSEEIKMMLKGWTICSKR